MTQNDWSVFSAWVIERVTELSIQLNNFHRPNQDCDKVYPKIFSTCPFCNKPIDPDQISRIEAEIKALQNARELVETEIKLGHPERLNDLIFAQKLFLARR